MSRARNSCLRAGRAGFTLLELLTVIVIIGLLAAMISAAVMMAKKRGREVARTAELATIKSALEAYRFEYQEWPCDEDAGEGDAPTGIVVYELGAKPNRSVIHDSLMNMDSAAKRNDRGIKYLNLGDYKQDVNSNLVDYAGNAYKITFDFGKDEVSVE